MKYILALISLVISNYLYQAATARTWDVAFERSYFQVIAGLIIYLLTFV